MIFLLKFYPLDIKRPEGHEELWTFFLFFSLSLRRREMSLLKITEAMDYTLFSQMPQNVCVPESAKDA